MTDITLDRYLINGTHAERVAFSPAPGPSAVGGFLLPIWYENDTGDVFLWDETTSAWIAWPGGGGGGGDLDLITAITTSGSQANVDFTGIATTWRDLEVRVRGRGNDGASSVEVRLQFNGDTGANYDYVNAGSNAAGGTAYNGAAADTSLLIGLITAAGAPANVPGFIECVVGNYRDTLFEKSTFSQQSSKLANSTTGMNQATLAGAWRSAAAINRVNVILSASTFLNGSVVSLYGRK